jgi:ribonucleotide reductase alpha subunit
MKAYLNDSYIDLVCPKEGHVGTEAAKTIFEEVIESAWVCGCPGLLFLDEINAKYRK